MRTQRKTPVWSWAHIGLSGLSATLLVLSFPDFEIASLAWVALAPLLLSIKRSGPAGAVLSALAVGLIFYSGLFLWAASILHALNSFLFVLANAAYFALFGLCAHFFHRSIPEWDALTFPTLWVLIEFVHAEFAFVAFPWGLLGYSQYAVLPVAKIASLTGVYGISFLLVAANGLLAELADLWPSGSGQRLLRGAPARKRLQTSVGILAASLLLLPASLLHGLSGGTESSERVRVAVVQAGQTSSDDPAQARAIFESYSRLSLTAADSAPDLIAWPSASVPGPLRKNARLVRPLSTLAQKTGTFLLVGSAGYDKLQLARGGRRYANSAFLFSPEGRVVGRYDKIRLLPFDEYLPLREHLRWPSWLVSSDFADAEPGKQRTVFQANGARFGVLICWENYFPDTFREMAAGGTQFMVSMTNEAFTNSSAAHHQMLAMNVFRAIENGIPIVRPATTGVSALITPSGRIVARVEGEHSDDASVKGYLVEEIPLSAGTTVYSRHGNWFVGLLAVVLIGLLGLRRARSTAPSPTG